MSEAEKILALINEAPVKGASDDKSKNRFKAAQTWVANFLAVSKYVAAAKEEGVEIKSENDLVKHIVELWEATAENKDDEIAKLFS